MDVEWLLSTLFDASLLSTSSRRQRRLFFVPFRDRSGGYGRRALKLARQLCRKVCRLVPRHTRPERAMLHPQTGRV